MKMKLPVSIALCAVSLFAGVAEARTVIQNKGSDTLVNVAQAWAEAYQKVDPKVAVAVSGGGSGTGIAALINGTVDIANASRAMKKKEIALAEKHGQHPLQHVVGFDALAVYVNKNNPAKSLSFEQLRDIFSRKGHARKWSDVGLTVPGCKNDEIVVVSRQNNSGTYAYFKKAVLGKKGKYRSGTLDMHGSKDVVDLVEKTPCAIGYSGLAYATEHVKTACIVGDKGGDCVNPSVATASDHSYPIARPLFMYTNGEAKGAIKQYLDWILSDAGQCIILAKGYAPMKAVSCK
ncbi:MAG: phosphate ABC transporter substrate-binding protein [gamma proteobacterium symbiont of Bathyaustriella thionipta]|nr:phosphate ABC transporter substrate-binding protein [gamma proteobacterium symbiont of Bathyaustriella thionipta]